MRFIFYNLIIFKHSVNSAKLILLSFRESNKIKIYLSIKKQYFEYAYVFELASLCYFKLFKICKFNGIFKSCNDDKKKFNIIGKINDQLN